MCVNAEDHSEQESDPRSRDPMHMGIMDERHDCGPMKCAAPGVGITAGGFGDRCAVEMGAVFVPWGPGCQ